MKKIFALLFTLLIIFFSFYSFVIKAEEQKETNVIFVGDVPDYTEGDLHLTVLNINTNKTYMFYLRDISDYTAYEYLPNGDYKIVEGGQYNDAYNKYQIEYKSFKVEDSNVVVEIKFGDSAIKANKDYNNNTQITSDNNKEYKQITEHKSWFYYIRWPLICIVFLGLVFLIYKMIKLFKNDY